MYICFDTWARTKMSYIRKTEDEWVIQSNYGYGWEDESCYDNYQEANYDIKEYRRSGYDAQYRLIKRRVKIDGTDT